MPPTSGTSSATSTTTFQPPPEPTTTTTELSQAERLLRGMTRAEKAAQILLIGFGGTTPSPELRAFIATHPPGGVLLLESNVASTAQLRRLTEDLQGMALKASPAGLLVAVDQEGGTVQRIHYQVPDVPSARVLGQTSTPAEAAGIAAETATGLLSVGVNMNLAPVADVVADKTSFLYRRSFGSDPVAVSGFVTAVLDAYQDAGLISTVKHFPGHGSARGNTHSDVVTSDAGLKDFESIHLPPFRAAISAGVEAVMLAHVVAKAYDPDHPASSSAIIVEDLLRDNLGFRGLVVTDDIQMEAAGGSSGDPQPGEASDGAAAYAVSALGAGCDLLISTGSLAQQQAVIDAVVTAVQTGTIEESRLDEAVLRILEVKLRHGISKPD